MANKSKTETEIEDAEVVKTEPAVETTVTEPVAAAEIPADAEMPAKEPDTAPESAQASEEKQTPETEPGKPAGFVTEPDPTPETEPKSEPAPESTPEPTSEPEPAPEPAPESEPEPTTEPVPASEPELDMVEDVEEEQHTSLAARVLGALFLIFIGIGLALWGAPKLAPILPAGMAPVAEFLMPGQSQAKSEIADLRREMETRIAAAETAAANAAADPKAIETAINKALETYNATISAELAEIKDTLAATDGQDIEARLATLETQIQGANAELAAVSERLSRQITENGVALSEEAGSKLSGYQAALEGLKAQVAELASKNGALSQKVEDIATASARRVEEAQADASSKVATTATKKLLTDISAALESGGGFKPSLDGLMEITKTDAPADLAAVAETGTASWTTLRNGFTEVAHEALRVDAKATAADGVLGKFGAFLKTKVGTRSLERKDGPGTDAILSRVEDDLVNRRLSAALAEANSLPDAPKAAMADWIAQLSALTKAQAALDALTAELGAT